MEQLLELALLSRRILVTGGAGFVGASLSLALAERHADDEIVALDNLYRRGSELNVPRLRAAGVRFMHGDVRELGDVLSAGPIDALVECSAEPSVLAGTRGDDPGYAVRTNLLGAFHCLELARRHDAQLVFLSTSRVYPVRQLLSIGVEEGETRLEIAAHQETPGITPRGISEAFPLHGARTLYGTTKLAAELLIGEYAAAYGLSAVVNRCGVIAGPWQMGKVDQGVFTYWMLAHVLSRPLRYIGFGGHGKQVRDLLHVDDLVDLVDAQLSAREQWTGVTVNVGGGHDVSLSLLETTDLCAEITGNRIDVGRCDEQRPGDIPIYISDCSRLFELTHWRPERRPRQILEDIHAWIRDNEQVVRRTL
jgi:CDP-paratose 2-epimerase